VLRIRRARARDDAELGGRVRGDDGSQSLASKKQITCISFTPAEETPEDTLRWRGFLERGMHSMFVIPNLGVQSLLLRSVYDQEILKKCSISSLRCGYAQYRRRIAAFPMHAHLA
jgi:hypothetical protein